MTHSMYVAASDDNGSIFFVVSGQGAWAGHTGSNWASTTQPFTWSIPAGETWVFAIHFHRQAGTANIDDSGCSLAVLIFNDNGTSSLFDMPQVRVPQGAIEPTD
jgi:hypothetical protein